MYFNYVEELNIKPENILVYLRKSRADDPILTVEEVLAKHEAILNEWAERNLDGNIPEENRFREVVSGETIADRPEIQKILRMMESPRIKAILTVEVQRLSRGDLEDAGRLIKLLRYTNTIVITPQKIYNLSDEYDRDSFERELKRGNEFLEYQKKIMGRGRLLSVSQGNYIGSIPPYGYDKVWVTEGKRKSPTLAINEDQANVIRMIFDLFVNQDMGLMTICNYLDNMHVKPPKGEYWSYPTVRDLISNIHYIGKVKWNWRKEVMVVSDSEIVKMRPKSKDGEYLVFDGKHDAIISEDLFNQAQEKKGSGTRHTKANKLRNPLAGLVYCHCGRAMSLRTYKNKEGKERCVPRLLCDGQIHCHTKSCTYDELLSMVSQILKKEIWNIEFQVKNAQNDSSKLQEELLRTLENKLQEIESRELAQWEAQASPDPSQRMPAEIFKKLNEKLQKEKRDTIEAIKTARATLPKPEEYQKKLFMIREALDALNNPNIDDEKKNRLLKACVERMTYSRNNLGEIELDVKMKVKN